MNIYDGQSQKSLNGKKVCRLGEDKKKECTSKRKLTDTEADLGWRKKLRFEEEEDLEGAKVNKIWSSSSIHKSWWVGRQCPIHDKQVTLNIRCNTEEMKQHPPAWLCIWAVHIFTVYCNHLPSEAHRIILLYNIIFVIKINQKDCRCFHSWRLKLKLWATFTL